MLGSGLPVPQLKFKGAASQRMSVDGDVRVMLVKYSPRNCPAEQVLPAWVTVKVCPAIIIFAILGEKDVFSATV
jgi:hypothetical protein